MNFRTRIGSAALIAASVGLCAGCSLIGRAEAPAVSYVLRSTITSSSQAMAAPVLKLSAVQAAPGYDTDRILMLRADRSLDFFAASRWATSVPRLVEHLAVEVWRSNGATATFDSAAPVSAGHVLRITVQRFDVEGEAGSVSRTARVRLRGTLQNTADRAVLADLQVDGVAPVTAERMSLIVAAFESAANEALVQLYRQVADARTKTVQDLSTTKP